MVAARSLLRFAVTGALSLGAPLLLSALGAGCSGEDGGDPDVDPIAWVSPSPGGDVEVDEVIELAAKVNEPRAQKVTFTVDGKELGTCARGQECQRADLFRWTTTFSRVGRSALVASFTLEGRVEEARTSLDVIARTASGEAGVVDDDGKDGGAPSDAGKDAKVDGPSTPPPPVDRGTLDPDRGSHNVFGGVSWSVRSQRVIVTSPPSLAVATVAACMQKYGASIRRHADAYKVSRASVLATAITESNCSNPSGSSDGLSSGPMQVTGSTCASVAGGGISASACKTKMYQTPDFSFQIGAKYMGSSYQKGQHQFDPPKIAAAYNAGSIRSTTANRWHMVVTGNHIERFVGAYNAYRDWETATGAAKAQMEAEGAARLERVFAGEHVGSFDDLPTTATTGQVVFVGDWDRREGVFVRFQDGRWEM